jgi:hypothetical protein
MGDLTPTTLGAPTVLVPGKDGTTEFRDFSFYDDGAAAAKAAAAIMDQNPDKAPYQVLSFDGYANLPTGRTDAMTVELRVYRADRGRSDAEFRMTVACPYRHARDAQGFAIYSPKLIECSGIELEHRTLFKHFYRGVASFKAGTFDWFKLLDESV